MELIPEVIAAMGHFKKATGDLSANKNLQILNANARRYVTATNKKYDVIVADLFHPSRDGAGSLYTVEHFTAIRRLLTERGLFCQWLPLYQLDLETLLRSLRGPFSTSFRMGRHSWPITASINRLSACN